MADIKAFKGLRYNPKIDMEKVTTPPYDVISKQEQDCYYKDSEYNVIRLEYGKQEEDDSECNNVYTRAKSYLKDFMDKNILIRDEKPAIYIYEQEFKLETGEMKKYKGIICLVKIEEFEKKIVLPHENTLSKAKTDRLNLMRETHANFSQIFCLYLDDKRTIPEILDESSKEKPQVSFSKDGIIQNLWVVTEEGIIENIIKEFKDKQLFIADGHHRYETALNFRNELRQQGNMGGDYVMMMLVDMDNEGLIVFPTHRLVKGISDFDESSLLKQVEQDFEITKVPVSEINLPPKTIGFYTGKDFIYHLKLKSDENLKALLPNQSKAYRELDVTLLHTLILEKIGINTDNMKDGENLVYTRDELEAINMVKRGRYQASFILNATLVKEIKDVSLENEKMPQKSTYFYPKLVTGIVMNKF